MASVPLYLRQQVISDANQSCEYCQTQQLLTGMPLVIDHIIPRSMGGNSDRANLAASCYRCNEFKGARTDAVDPQTEAQVSLFHPRQQIWTEHFAWTVEGTIIADNYCWLDPHRATVNALKLNNEYVVESRKIWVAENWHPPNF